MARPPTWLPRLRQLRQGLANSVRSHYDRKDLERLFELPPRSVGKLLELLPTAPGRHHPPGRARGAGELLETVREADDVVGLLEQLRQEKTARSRRRLRSLVRHDLEPVCLTSLPDSITLSRGRLKVTFGSFKQLAEATVMLARVLESEGEEFAERSEPEEPQWAGDSVD